jgi:muramoyltetrapeptide carboxypeptidase
MPTNEVTGTAKNVRARRTARADISEAARSPISIGFVAPSGRLPDTASADCAAQFFAQRGWRVQAGESVFARNTRFAGDDDLRAADLQRFATDASLDIVMAARGGYGLSRILDQLDFDAIAAATRSGRMLVGYSDFTAFNLALLARTDAISFQGPSSVDFAAARPDAFMVRQFFATLTNKQHALAFRTSAPDLAVQGRLWGGNLALLCALLGTRYFPAISGGILFVEDVNEPAYKIERMLLQLAQAGVIGRQRALVLGRFDPVPPMPNDYGYRLKDAIARIAATVRVPIVPGLPFGHVPRKATLPVGAPARLAVSGGRAELSFSGYPHIG